MTPTTLLNSLRQFTCKKRSKIVNEIHKKIRNTIFQEKKLLFTTIINLATSVYHKKLNEKKETSFGGFQNEKPNEKLFYLKQKHIFLLKILMSPIFPWISFALALFFAKVTFITYHFFLTDVLEKTRFDVLQITSRHAK